MPELELEGLAAEGEAEDLVAEADAEDGQLADELADLRVDVRQGGGVARSVGEEEAVGLEGEHFLRRGVRAHDGDVEAGAAQAAQDVALDAEVVGDDAVLHGRQFGVEGEVADGLVRQFPVAGFAFPVVVLRRGDFRDEVAAAHGGGGAGALDGFALRQLGGEAGALGAVGAQQAGELAGVDAFDAGDAVAGEPVAEGFLGAPVGMEPGEFADGEAAHLGAGGFVVFFADAVVADERVGHRDDLSPVGRIRQHFLVAGHGGVEAGFARHRSRGAEGASLENRTVF